MKIHFPNSAFLGNLDGFLSTLDTSNPEALEITANKKWISIHPAVLCMAAALGLIVDKVKVEKLEARSKHYLERMGLFKFLGVDSGMCITEHEPAGRFIPLTQIKNSGDLTKFLREMIPLLHLQPEQAESINCVVSELVRNVLEHSMSPQGAILCAQYYKGSNMIRVGIADTGMGIKRSIMKSHIVTNDLDAIKLALTPGITGTTPKEGGTEYNAGAGLFFIKSIAKVNRNFFAIYSGTSMYKLLKGGSGTTRIRLFANPFNDKHSKKDELPPWQGTVVGIDISLEKTTRFTALLDIMRETFVKSVKDRTKEKYRTPRFT